MKRKLELMHDLFGIIDNHKCRECSNLHGGTNQYRKCKVYGISASEATDWALSWTACGMMNKEHVGRPIIDMVKHRNRFSEETMIDGQMSFAWENMRGKDDV